MEQLHLLSQEASNNARVVFYDFVSPTCYIFYLINTFVALYKPK